MSDWMVRALCRDEKDGVFFDTYDDGEYIHLEKAKLLCELCPVRSQCLDYALRFGSSCVGIWAGTVEKDRKNIRDRFKQDEDFKQFIRPAIESYAQSVCEETMRRLQGVLQ